MFELKSNKSLSEKTAVVKTCDICGHSGPDVSAHYWYVGGKGYVYQVTCDDQDACKTRAGVPL